MRRLAGTFAVITAAGVAIAGSAHAATDEDQVRAVLDGMNGAYNRSDYDAFASHVCVLMRQATGYEAGWHASRSADGPTRITINSIRVTGDPPDLAVANVRFEAANHEDTKTLDVDLLREGTQWLACRYESGHPV